MSADSKGIPAGADGLDGDAATAGCSFAARYPFTACTDVVEQPAERFPGAAGAGRHREVNCGPGPAAGPNGGTCA